MIIMYTVMAKVIANIALLNTASRCGVALLGAALPCLVALLRIDYRDVALPSPAVVVVPRYCSACCCSRSSLLCFCWLTHSSPSESSIQVRRSNCMSGQRLRSAMRTASASN